MIDHLSFGGHSSAEFFNQSHGRRPAFRRAIRMSCAIAVVLLVAACGSDGDPLLSPAVESDTLSVSATANETAAARSRHDISTVQSNSIAFAAAVPSTALGNVARIEQPLSSAAGSSSSSANAAGTDGASNTSDMAIAATTVSSTQPTGKIIYVAVDGSDAYSGTSAAPFATLQRAVDLAQPGDTVVVKPGTYSISTPVRVVSKVGATDRVLTVVGMDGAVLRAAAAGVPGVWRGVVEIDGSSFVSIGNLSVTGSSFFGFRIQDSHDIVLRANKSTVSLASGIYASSSANISIVENDVSRFCDKNQYGASPDASCQEGITLSQVDGFNVIGNKVHDAPQSAGVGPGGGEGIDAKNGSRNGVIAFNKVWNLVQLGIYIDGWVRGVQTIHVYGNRVWNTYMGIVVSSEAGGLVSDIAIHDNIIYNVGQDGIQISKISAQSPGDGPRQRISIYNNTIANAGVKESKPPFYVRWAPEPFPDAGNGINVATTNVSALSIVDNIIVGSKTYAMTVPGSVRSANLLDNNLIWPRKTWMLNDAYDGSRPIYADPLFVSSATNDFHLTTPSPAVGTGTGLGPRDLDADGISVAGRTRDLGALVLRK